MVLHIFAIFLKRSKRFKVSWCFLWEVCQKSKSLGAENGAFKSQIKKRGVRVLKLWDQVNMGFRFYSHGRMIRMI
jgi:hypothetical protein